MLWTVYRDGNGGHGDATGSFGLQFTNVETGCSAWSILGRGRRGRGRRELTLGTRPREKKEVSRGRVAGGRRGGGAEEGEKKRERVLHRNPTCVSPRVAMATLRRSL